MVKITLNVGMNIGDIGTLNLTKTKERITKLYAPLVARNTQIEFQKTISSYTTESGVQKEPTIVVQFTADNGFASEVYEITKTLCIDTFQECIALYIEFEYIDNKGLLVYNPNYKGIWQDFDMKYFKKFKKSKK